MLDSNAAHRSTNIYLAATAIARRRQAGVRASDWLGLSLGPHTSMYLYRPTCARCHVAGEIINYYRVAKTPTTTRVLAAVGGLDLTVCMSRAKAVVRRFNFFYTLYRASGLIVVRAIQLKPGFHPNAIVCVACVWMKTGLNASACNALESSQSWLPLLRPSTAPYCSNV